MIGNRNRYAELFTCHSSCIVLLVFSMEKIIDLGKAFDMIHETDGKGHWFGKGIWYDSWNIPPLYTEILHTSDATKRSRSCTQKLVSIYS